MFLVELHREVERNMSEVVVKFNDTNKSWIYLDRVTPRRNLGLERLIRYLRARSKTKRLIQSRSLYHYSERPFSQIHIFELDQQLWNALRSMCELCQKEWMRKPKPWYVMGWTEFLGDFLHRHKQQDPAQLEKALIPEMVMSKLTE